MASGSWLKDEARGALQNRVINSNDGNTAIESWVVLSVDEEECGRRP